MRQGRSRLIAVLLATALGGGAVVVAGVAQQPRDGNGTAPATGTATVQRRTLNATTQVSGTLGYADTYAITNALATTADPSAALSSLGSAQEKYESAVDTLEALRNPTAKDIADAQLKVAQKKASLLSAQQAAAGARTEFEHAARDLERAKAAAAADTASARLSLQKAGTTLATARANFATLVEEIEDDIDAYEAAIGPAQDAIAEALASTDEILPSEDTDQMRESLNDADISLANAARDAADVLRTALYEYVSTVGGLDDAVAAFEAAVSAGRDPTASVRAYQTANYAYQLAASRLSDAVDVPDKEVSDASTSVTSAGAILDTLETQDRSVLDEERETIADLRTALAEEDQLAATMKTKVTQATSSLATITESVTSSYVAAQHAYDDAITKGEESVQAAEDALASAQEKADPSVSAHGVELQDLELEIARAEVASALADLDALRDPTAVQLQRAADAVSRAAASLDEARRGVDQPRGIVTHLAELGSVVEAGAVLYTLDGRHSAVLMTGAVPAWRRLEPGIADGVDVRQLEEDLGALGFGSASLVVDQHWDDATTAAVRDWQRSLGLPETGAIPLGQVVFEPVALRITARSATVGATVQPGTAILQATSTTRVVTVALEPSLQSKVKKGDPVTVTLPDGKTAAGAVSYVSRVAATAEGSDSPTITVLVTLNDPAAGGSFDQAPVTLAITTATAKDVLAVPVSALVQVLEGGYAVQVKEGDQLRYVRVELGLFAGGWVEVSGPDLAEGQTVVVAQ